MFSCWMSPPSEVRLSEKEKKWRRTGGSRGQGIGGSWKGGGADVGCLLFKARFSPDTSVLFINSFSRAVKNQCVLHCKQFIMTGGWEKKGGKKLNCNRIDLFKYNNTVLQRGGGWGAQTKPDWQYETTSSNWQTAVKVQVSSTQACYLIKGAMLWTAIQKEKIQFSLLKRCKKEHGWLVNPVMLLLDRQWGFEILKNMINAIEVSTKSRKSI